MSGHKIEICGLHGPTPKEQQAKEREGVDISDLGAIQHAVTTHNILDPAEVSMVVWGEDLARVPLLVYDAVGDLLWQAPELTEQHAAYLDVAAQLANKVIEQEHLAANPA